MSDTIKTRAAMAADTEAFQTILRDAEMFGEDELIGFGATVAEALVADAAEGDWLVADLDGRVAGAAYMAAEGMTGEHRNLLFLGTATDARRRGVAAALLDHAEGLARDAGAGLLLVETGSTAQFAPARALYDRQGFAVDGRVRGYFGAGGDKVIFRKTL